jgi:hypothetical protein
LPTLIQRRTTGDIGEHNGLGLAALIHAIRDKRLGLWMGGYDMRFVLWEQKGEVHFAIIIFHYFVQNSQ